MLSKTYRKTSQSDLKEKIYAIFKEMAVDDTPMVRRAAAINLGEFALAVRNPLETIVESYKSLLSDQQDAVKIESLKNSVILAKLIIENNNQDRILDDIIKPVQTAAEDKKSWRLRFSVAELIGDLTDTIGDTLASEHVGSVIEQLFIDSEPEVRSETIIRFQKVVKIVSSEKLIEKLIAISEDTSQHVRESLAECLCEI